MSGYQARVWCGACRLAVGGVLLAVLGGCARQADISLHQPFAPQRQRNLNLASSWVYHDIMANQQATVLAFPLPGATGGTCAFSIYLRGPNTFGEVKVDPASENAVRGFLLQEVGALAGRSNLTGGTVTYQKVALAPRWRKLILHVSCEDGTQIEGQAMVEVSPNDVQAFERRHAGDIAQLTPPATSSDNQSADPAASTP